MKLFLECIFWAVVATYLIIFIGLGAIELLVVATQGVVIFAEILIAGLFIGIGFYLIIFENSKL